MATKLKRSKLLIQAGMMRSGRSDAVFCINGKINQLALVHTFQVSMSPAEDWTNLFSVLATKIHNNLNNLLAGIALAEHLPLFTVRIK